MIAALLDATETPRCRSLAVRVAIMRGSRPVWAWLACTAHYLRGQKWFTNLGDVDTCSCGNPWPCSELRGRTRS